MISAYRNSEMSVAVEEKPTLKQQYLLLHDACNHLGIGCFSVFDAETISQNPIGELVFHNWPPGVLECSAAALHTVKGNISNIAKNTIVPFHYSFSANKPHTTNEDEIDLFDTVTHLELFEGWVVPAHGPSNKLGFVALGKFSKEISKQNMAFIQNICLQLFDCYFDNKIATAQSENQINKGEKRVLSLLKDGSSIYEISQATGLSEIAINSYCEKVVKTLGAKSITQAVLIAMKNDII